MKKTFFLFIVLFACCLAAQSQSQSAPWTFGSEAKNSAQQPIESLTAQKIADQDRQLAATIKRLTNRSTEGLVEKKIRGGGFLLDLQERFQNVMLAKIDNDSDEPTAACVTSLDEANEFFGKNLETGAPIAATHFQKDESATLAARYGMSGQEFEFYKSLIEDAAIRRLQSPNSASISIVNSDGAGEGFNDTTVKVAEGGNSGTTLGEQRLNLFNYAASIWSAYLDTSVAIKINSHFDSLTCTSTSATLGSAGTAYTTHDFTNAEFANTDYHLALANKRAGYAIGGSSIYQINATFNSDVNNNSGCLASKRFYYGFDNTTPSGTVNLLVVLLHEMGHGLGFSSFVTGSTGVYSSGRPDIFSRYMYDRSVNKYWYQMTDAERQTSALNSGNLFWDGANVKIASSFLTAGRDTSTGRVQLYTPNPYQSGSSISHWDTSATTNLLMEPSINTGLPTTLDLTRELMRDIGWYRDTTADLVADTITNVQTSNVIVIGTSATVQWTNNGGFNRNVTIELSTDGGATYPTTIASDVTNSGSYTFTAPSVITSQARIRVREAGFVAPMAASASNFYIQLAPTAAAVSISGRVLDARGNGVSRARVFISGNNGTVIFATTDLQGHFRFDEIASGETYVFQVTHKLYTFAPQVLNITEDADNLTFSAQYSVKK